MTHATHAAMSADNVGLCVMGTDIVDDIVDRRRQCRLSIAGLIESVCQAC